MDSSKSGIRFNRRIIIITAVILAAAVLLTAAAATYKNIRRFSADNPLPLSNIFIKRTDREKIHLTAQRGFSCQAPENTLPAIELAAGRGFDSVEISARRTSDGVWVVFADAGLAAMTDKSGSVSGYTYYDLVTCRINRGANIKKYGDLRIPTLDRVLRLCLEKNLRPMIDLRSDGGIDTLLSLIDRNGFTESCAVICSEETTLEAIHKKNERINLILKVKSLKTSLAEKRVGKPYGGVAFDAGKGGSTRGEAEKILKSGVTLYAYNVKTAKDAERLYEYGVTEFITDRIYK
ncbi:MAG: hypothetical protein IJT03_07505 [Clostridia bacterium]|nr:hypothetical protein [Clostridia bacterium]